MEKILLETLERMTKEKILKKRFPTYVLYLELKRELGDEIGKDLNKLAKAGKIKNRANPKRQIHKTKLRR